MRAVLAIAAILLCGGAIASSAKDGRSERRELVVNPDALVPVQIDGKAARLRILSAPLDRPMLSNGFVAANHIRSTSIKEESRIIWAGRQEFEGKNHPLILRVGGRKWSAPVSWFPTMPDGLGDGSIGPWSLPQRWVTFQLRPISQRDHGYRMPLAGSIDTGSYTGWVEKGFGMVVSFNFEDMAPDPVASAAAGAAIALAYGGTVSGASWDRDMGMGVKRPVRLMTLRRPFVFGPFAFTHIAVRVRDRVDEAGRGASIREATAQDDPSEIVVVAKATGPKPAFDFTIPRAALNACARVTYDKWAEKILLWCRPAAEAAGR